jgi:hypothetical protein
MGHPFQSPFAKPHGQGLSSATVNVVWGFFNAVVGYLLIAHVGAFHPRVTSHILAFGLGALLSGALFAAGCKNPGLASLSMGAGVFGLGCTLAALAPGYWWFAAESGKRKPLLMP